MKRPAFQFYPGDWRTDPGLRLCSVGARGLWIEMMCLMHEGEPYGHLTVQGRPMTPEALARLVGEGAAAVKRWLAELDQNDVFSRDENGLIFSRRMVRDEEVREARAAGGHAGAEHGKKGASHGIKGGRPRNEKPPSRADGRGVSEPPPSTSSPSPSSEPTLEPSGPKVGTRATRLPADFVPELTDEMRAIVAKWPPTMLRDELAQFKDRNVGKGTTAKDWQATFRTWVRNADKWRHQRNGRSAPDPDGLSSTARAAIRVFGDPRGGGEAEARYG